MADQDHGPRVGADPELFVTETAGFGTAGKVIPICGKIGGTKENPRIIDNLIEANYGPEGRRRISSIERIGNFAVQEDNVMLEFNIPAYGDTSSVTNALDRMLTTIELNVLSPLHLSHFVSPQHTFEAAELAKHRQAMTVGCLADRNAYTDSDREPFSSTIFGNNRFCGGHLHVQYNKALVPPHIFAQFMDLFVELPFLNHDKQKMRRAFYGQPGIYREKPYGIEYRTPSNFWLTSTFRGKYLSLMIDNIFSLARTANTDPEALKQLYARVDWEDVQTAIREENIKLAREILEYQRGFHDFPISTSIG